MTIENATETVTVKASNELLAEMKGQWSEPLQVMATRSPQGDWELVFRKPDGYIIIKGPRVNGE